VAGEHPPVAIRHVEVEGGFLDGLSVDFANGLVVLAGARGTGKTSLIELIRFAVGAQPLAPSRGDPHRQARAILDAGRVSVTVQTGDELRTFTRSALDADSRLRTGSISSRIVVLAQNEIEEVGLDPLGRLNLIDGFRPRRTRLEGEEDILLDRIATLTHEIRAASEELSALSDQISELGDLDDLRVDADFAREELGRAPSASAPVQNQLGELSQKAGSARSKRDMLERSLNEIRSWIRHIEEASRLAPSVFDEVTADSVIATHIATADKHLDSAIAAASAAATAVELQIGALTQQMEETERSTQILRRQLDEAQEGLSALTRRVGRYEESRTRVEDMNAQILQKRASIASLNSDRENRLSELSAARMSRSTDREGVVAQLNAQLQPKIEVSLTQSGMTQPYAEALAAGLKGSSLHYNTIVPVITSAVAPHELVRLVEAGDPKQLHELTGIDQDRCTRVVAYLSEQDLSELITSDVDDAVQFSLLDESVYKASEDLSTGQRCTVVLPLVLTSATHLVIVDQPEDHLDNGFIVSTLVRVIRERKSQSQLIMSTHNANIPVLGEAEQVVWLGSNGRRGYVQHSGAFDEEGSVRVITSLMEGGREAFEQRAAFYQSHPDA
jgi:energy-coupling factor transporter ATP-binding protein EcfA2